MKKKKTKYRGYYVKKLDSIFSKYIRRRFAEDDIATCYTCGKKDHWKNLQCGHFMSRRFFSTRWDDKNCQVQCKACNIFRYGEQYLFGANLDKEFGDGTAEMLEFDSKQLLKISMPQLKILILKYEELVKEMD